MIYSSVSGDIRFDFSNIERPELPTSVECPILIREEDMADAARFLLPPPSFFFGTDEDEDEDD